MRVAIRPKKKCGDAVTGIITGSGSLTSPPLFMVPLKNRGTYIPISRGSKMPTMSLYGGLSSREGEPLQRGASAAPRRRPEGAGCSSSGSGVSPAFVHSYLIKCNRRKNEQTESDLSVLS